MRSLFAALCTALFMSAALAQAPLKVASPPQVLQNPKVQQCRMLVVDGLNPKLKAGESQALIGVQMFDVVPVMEALSFCREALALFPTEPSVITAEFTASLLYKTLLFGIRRPTDDAALLSEMLAHEKDSNPPALFGSLGNFFIGSSFEHGIGVPVDRDKAIRYYAKAAESDAPGAAVAKDRIAKLGQR